MRRTEIWWGMPWRFLLILHCDNKAGIDPRNTLFLQPNRC